MHSAQALIGPRLDLSFSLPPLCNRQLVKTLHNDSRTTFNEDGARWGSGWEGVDEGC